VNPRARGRAGKDGKPIPFKDGEPTRAWESRVESNLDLHYGG
jgi:hypothetical protein